ncbi:MAG: hypothetical protein KAI18_02475 [Candidatus Aenigmarchaeota archaeon]|nr:hypothetical protein [Candidatus Aenigmarchaeota archaeon]
MNYNDSSKIEPVINTTEITEGNGYDDNAASMQYDDGRYKILFEHIGILNGYTFLNEVTFMNDENETSVLLRITPDMDPKDSIAEIYIVPTINNEVLDINIYLDEDFRKMMGNNTNIIWGSTYQNFKVYDFSIEHKPGIYVDTVYDNNTERFLSGGSNDANIFVGDATLADAQTQNMEGITGVFLK